MDSDDLAPPPRPAAGPALESLSVAELHAHITALEAEIARARALIGAKEKARLGADALFKTRT